MSEGMLWPPVKGGSGTSAPPPSGGTYTPPPIVGCRLRLGSDISIASPGARVPWVSEEYDTDGLHDNAVNPTRITIKEAGYYLLHGALSWAASSSGLRNTHILKNGQSIGADIADYPASGDSTRQTFATVLYCEPGDYLEMDAWHNSGSARTVQHSWSHFGCMKIDGGSAGLNVWAPSQSDLLVEEFADLTKWTVELEAASMKIHDGKLQPTTNKGPKRLIHNTFSGDDAVLLAGAHMIWNATYGSQLGIGWRIDANNQVVAFLYVNNTGTMQVGIEQKLAGAYTYDSPTTSAGLAAHGLTSGDKMWMVLRRGGGNMVRVEGWVHDPRLGGTALIVQRHRLPNALLAAGTLLMELYPNANTPADTTAIADGAGMRVDEVLGRKRVARPTGWF